MRNSERVRRFKTLCSALTVLLGLLSASCVLSVMFAFMGAETPRGLVIAQVAGLSLSLLLGVIGIAYFTTFRGLAAGITLAWHHTPGWLAFAASVCASLALLGELSYYLIRHTDLDTVLWSSHLALLCLASAAISMCIVYAVGHAADGATPYEKARW